MGGVQNLTDLLPTYYARLFPFPDYYKWLSYGNSNKFSRREFSFTIQEDIYLRFQSFDNIKQLESEIKRLVPSKIDIGAIYNVRPKDHRTGPQFRPIERELVFDIDMTDYDEVRTCCEGASVCNKCWKFMSLACKIIDVALREDFGYKHILWIFSGRRGIHCWVCDPSARILSVVERSAVAEYLQIIGGGEFMKKKVNLPGDKIHHSIRRALNLIESSFVEMCVDEQNMLGTPKEIEKFLSIIPDEEDRQKLKETFDQCPNSITRWDEFLKLMKGKKTSGKKWYQYRHLVEEIMLQYAYPRLDINVSKGMNHLLKSPFCVHPKTGKVCIPFTANTVDKFDPDKVPTIMTLINEINEFDKKEKNEQEGATPNTNKIKDYKKTSLNRSLRVFNEFLWGLQEARQEEKKDETESTLEF